MKKIFAIFILVLFHSVSFAQSFKGGIIAGMTASQYDGDTYVGFHRIGIDAGVFVNRNISKKFSWQLEMKYVQKGSFQSPSLDPQNPSPKYDLRLNYIEVPFLIKYAYKKKLSFEAGLSLGYLAAHHENINDSPVDPNSVPSFHKMEFSYQLGLSYKLFDKLYVDARYLYSIFPVRPHNGGATYRSNFGEYNNVISFTFYYQFNKPDE